MPMDAAQLTLAKLNSYLGGKGGEWGSELPPSGAAVPAEIRGRARELGNQGKTAEAADLLLQQAVLAKAALPPALLDEVEARVLPAATNQNTRASMGGNLALLRHRSPAASPAKPATGSLLNRLFGRR